MSRLFKPIRENGHSLKDVGLSGGLCKGQEQPIDFDEYTPQMLEYCVNDVKLNELVYYALLKNKQGLVNNLLILNTELLG